MPRLLAQVKGPTFWATARGGDGSGGSPGGRPPPRGPPQQQPLAQDEPAAAPQAQDEIDNDKPAEEALLCHQRLSQRILIRIKTIQVAGSHYQNTPQPTPQRQLSLTGYHLTYLPGTSLGSRLFQEMHLQAQRQGGRGLGLPHLQRGSPQNWRNQQGFLRNLKN